MRRFLVMAVFLLIAAPLLAGEGREAEYLRQGTRALAAKNFEKAAKAFEEAARLNPDSAEAHRGAGTAYMQLGSGEVMTNPQMLTRAVAAFREALRLDPASTQTRYQLGVTCLALDDWNGAVREYEALRMLDEKAAQNLLTLINGYKPPPSYRAVDGAGESGGSMTRVTVAGNHVFVPVTLSHGDRTVQATLILDTGASVTLINREVAQRLNIDLERAPRSQVQVVGGGVVDAWVARLDRVTAGPHTKSGIDVAVVDHRGGGFAYDGLLGMNFLRSFNYRIDFANQVINWAP
jgi:clan AA aspartic protease (TIGR02281 family)